ncbi:MAG: DUF4258 domain-containing protein [bacterium]|nr:DUF4258 domain-containing protein [bacterium]
MKSDIVFSGHALLKIDILNKHGLHISQEIIEDIIRFPDIIEKGYKGRTVAQKAISEDHVLRVIYEFKDNIIYVITIYPGRRSRYEKD